MAEKAYQIAFDNETVDQAFYGDVVSLTVEEECTRASTLRLQVALTLQDDGTWNHLEDDRFALFTKVSVKIGFTGGGGLAGALGGVTGGNDGLAPVFDGYITAVNVNLGSGPESAFLEVSGM